MTLWMLLGPEVVKRPCETTFSIGGRPHLHLYLHSSSGARGLAFQGSPAGPTPGARSGLCRPAGPQGSTLWGTRDLPGA